MFQFHIWKVKGHAKHCNFSWYPRPNLAGVHVVAVDVCENQERGKQGYSVRELLEFLRSVATMCLRFLGVCVCIWVEGRQSCLSFCSRPCSVSNTLPVECGQPRDASSEMQKKKKKNGLISLLNFPLWNDRKALKGPVSGPYGLADGIVILVSEIRLLSVELLLGLFV